MSRDEDIYSPLASQIAARAKQRQAIPVPEYGITMYLPLIAGQQRDRYLLDSNGQGARTIEAIVDRAEDEHGQKLFKKGDKALMMRTFPYTIADRIMARNYEWVPPELDPED